MVSLDLAAVDTERLARSVVMLGELETSPDHPVVAKGIGTAFCIATYGRYQALFLTAQHNFADYMDAQETPLAIVCRGEESWAMIRIGLFGVQDEHNDMAVFTADVRHLATTEKPARPVPLRVWASAEPQVDDECFAFGYSGVDGRPLAIVSAGNIQQVHSHRRDSFFVNYPAVQTSAEFVPGMSGGPLLTPRGAVLGVVSSGMGGGSGGGGMPTGYASLIGAAGLLPFAVYEENDPQPPTRPDKANSGVVQALKQAGVIVNSGSGRMRIQRSTEEGVRLSWQDL